MALQLINQSMDRKSSKESFDESSISSKNDRPNSIVLNKMADLIKTLAESKKNNGVESKPQINGSASNKVQVKKHIIETIKNYRQQWEIDTSVQDIPQPQQLLPQQVRADQIPSKQLLANQQAQQRQNQHKQRKPKIPPSSSKNSKTKRPLFKEQKKPQRSSSRLSVRVPSPPVLVQPPRKKVYKKKASNNELIEGRFVIRIQQDKSIGLALKQQQKTSSKSPKPTFAEVKFVVKLPLMADPKPTIKNTSILKNGPSLQTKQVSKKNLGSCSIFEIIEQIFCKGLIARQLYNQFKSNHSALVLKDFLQKFKKGKLRKFDFNKMKFTILDHRRLTELLIRIYPEQYTQQNLSAETNELYAFIQSMYDLTAKEYFDLYTKIDSISQIKWWKEVLANNKAKIQQGVKKSQTEKPTMLKGNLREPNEISVFEPSKKRVKFA